MFRRKRSVDFPCGGVLFTMANSKKYRITYDRINCIGAGSCVISYPERWVMNRVDDKADLIGGKEITPHTWEIEFTEEELDKFLESAQVCPVNVIHIYDEAGKKVI